MDLATVTNMPFDCLCSIFHVQQRTEIQIANKNIHSLVIAIFYQIPVIKALTTSIDKK